MSDLHNRDRVRTRKEHKCEGCLEVIPKGSTVNHCKGRWQGDWYDYHMCDACIHYIIEYPLDMNGGFTPGEIGDYRKDFARSAIESTEPHNEVEAVKGLGQAL